MGSRRTFKKYGQSGLEISDIFENVGKYADDLAVVRSCYHDTFIHGPALSLLHTGSIRLGGASAGAWVLYGLGSESRQSARVHRDDGQLRPEQQVVVWGRIPAGGLSGHAGINRRYTVSELEPAPQIDASRQRLILDQLQAWNQQYEVARSDDSRFSARLNNYELAFRMQMAAPELIDLSEESARDAFPVWNG